MATISVIMGIYNCEQYLDEALSSLVKQNYKDFEVILCDDGSKDHTLDVAQKWVQRDSRIKLFQNDRNHGLAYTLNHCLENVSGKYVVRMDGDDRSTPDRFEKLLVAIEKQYPDFDVIGTGCDLFDDEGIWGEVITKGVPDKLGAYLQKTVSHATVIMKTDSLKSVNGYDAKADSARAEDYDLWCRMVEKGLKITSIPEKLYQVRWDRKNYYSRRPFKTNLAWARLVRYWYKRMNLGISGLPKVIMTYIKLFVPNSIKSLYHKHHLGQ